MEDITYAGLYDKGKAELLLAGIENPDFDARALLLYTFNINLNYFYLEGRTKIPQDKADKIESYKSYIKKRASHFPLQYITGFQNFCGLDFFVNEAVLIPRQDTEALVEIILKKEAGYKNPGNKKRLLDICTGSGAIAIALKKLGNFEKVCASDISKEALKVAKKNAELNKAEIMFIESDMFKNLKLPYKFDVIVSNPPYIKSADIASLMPEVAAHEPLQALDGDKNGLYFYKILAQEAGSCLAAGGRVYLEIGSWQAAEVVSIFQERGFENIEVEQDLAGFDRVISMIKPQAVS